MKTATRKASKKIEKARAKTERVHAGGGIMVDVVTANAKATKAEKPAQLFQGKIAGTKLFVKDMEGFSKKQGNGCPAKSWLFWNEQEGTVTFVNTYREDNQPKASFKPEDYTFQFKEKVHGPKMDAMKEVDPVDDGWPEWAEHAGGRKRAKTKTK